jgi:tyrosyl-tRNA synthetase
VNSEDATVGALLRTLTFLSRDEIAAIEAASAAQPESRTAQKALAREMTSLVHGPDALDAAVRASEILFGGPLDDVSEAIFADVVGEVPTTSVGSTSVAGAGLPVADALVGAGLSASKSQARRDVEAGGVYVNNRRCADVTKTVTAADLLFGKYVLLRKGKRSYAVVRIE